MSLPPDLSYTIAIVFTLLLVVTAGLFISAVSSPGGERIILPILRSFDFQHSVPAAMPASPLISSFGHSGVLQERSAMSESSNPYWWLNSGGEMYFSDGAGSTIENSLSRYDRWRIAYANSSPVDTDNGYYPQNLFRLVSRQKWLNYRQEMYFEVLRDNLSQSSNRNESNGVFLLNRYQDGEDLYYTGVRVDGMAVIKKKLRGSYSTIAIAPVWSSSTNYDRQTNPSLLPKNHWIGLASEITNGAGGIVLIKLFVDQAGDGRWKKVLETIDGGVRFGPVINLAGFTGIRSDFMDVTFKQYKLVNIN